MQVFTKDKTWQSGAYFDEKNGIKPIVKAGRNFDNDELFYMSKPRVSKYIANKIESITFNKPYFMIEICAGIGGNTTEFASRKNCATIMAFERDTQRSIYLQRNLKAYKLDDKAVVVNREITGEEDFSTYPGSIFYFDPPWLPADYRSTDGNYKIHYIRKDMKVGELSLEQWLEKLKPVAYMVGIRVPDNYDLGEVDGWTYETENLGKTVEMKASAEDGKLFFCFNNSFVKGASDTKFGGYIKNFTSFKMKLNYTDTALADKFLEYRNYCSKLARSKSSVDEDCPFVKYRFIDPEPEELLPAKVVIEEKVSPKAVVVAEEPEDIPIEKQVPVITGIPKPSKGLEPGTPEWIAEFQNYLSVILGKFITKEGKPYTELINSLLIGEYMVTWLAAFTTRSANPEEDKNYETLEIIGDAVYEYALMMKLPGIMKKFGLSVNEETINNVRQKYKSGKSGGAKGFQTYLGDAFQFKEWITKGKLETLEETINEDLLESFYGALHEIGNKVGKTGTMGVKLVWTMTDFWIRDIQISKKFQESDNKTNVTQRFPRIGIPDKEAVFEAPPIGGGRDWTAVIKLTDKAFDRLVFEEIPINIRDIGVGKGTSSNEAKNNAWLNADRYLDSVGFTVAKSIEIKENTNWKLLKKNYTAIYNEFNQVAKRNGISNPKVVFDFIIKNEKNEYYIVLTQTTDKGIRKVGEGRAKERLQAMANALDYYINK
jgi:dsRNA-specific ribonuclease/16S rRNA G966 N2-methylase RsmD